MKEFSVSRKHNVGRTEGEFEYDGSELRIDLEYFASNCYQSSDVTLTLTAEEVEKLKEILK